MGLVYGRQAGVVGLLLMLDFPLLEMVIESSFGGTLGEADALECFFPFFVCYCFVKGSLGEKLLERARARRRVEPSLH